jgi:hypothetical protein
MDDGGHRVKEAITLLIRASELLGAPVRVSELASTQDQRWLAAGLSDAADHLGSDSYGVFFRGKGWTILL